MPIKSKYLVAEKDGLLAHYDILNNDDMYVIRDTKANEYLLFESFEDTIEFINDVHESNKRTYEEVILGNKRHRFAIDIDCENVSDETIEIIENMYDLKDIQINQYLCKDAHNIFPSWVMKMLYVFIEAVKDTLFIKYRHNIRNRDVVILSGAYDLSGEFKMTNKWSFHLIFKGFAVDSYLLSKDIAMSTSTLLHPAVSQYLDFNLYASNHNLRLVGMNKPDGQMTLKIISTSEVDHMVGDSMVTRVKENDPILEDASLVQQINPLVSGIPANILNDIIIETEARFPGQEFRSVANNLLLFNRVHESHCEFCNTVHNKDNTLFVSYVSTDENITAYACCRRNMTTKVRIYHKLVGEQTKTSMIEKVIKSSYKESEESILVDESFDEVLRYDMKDMKSFDFRNCDTMFVHAPMKMGKTKKLKSFIEGLVNPKIRFVSFRRTFSADINARFDDFILYSDVTGRLVQQKLIIQVESLHRLAIGVGDVPDLLILDESESIIEQFSSGLTKDFSGCFAVFKWLMKNSKKVIMMDAFMSNRTYNVCNAIRPRSSARNVHKYIYHRNECKNAIDDSYFITTEEDTLVQKLYDCLINDNKCALATNSIKAGKAIMGLMSEKMPNIRIGFYCSETLESVKRKHFSDVNEYWANYDLLIYTPTASAGVSFEVKYYEYMFGYFVDESCPSETCIQMLGRIRNVGSNEIYMYIAPTRRAWPTTIDSIAARLMYSRQTLDVSQRVDSPIELGRLDFEYDVNGIARYNRNEYFTLFLENMRIVNMSRNNLLKRMSYLLGLSGASVNIFEMDKIVPGLLMKLAKTKVDNVTADEISVADDIHRETFKDLMKKNEIGADITRDEQLQIKKFRLSELYKIPGHHIDKDFVLMYSKPMVKSIFINLCSIVDHDDWPKSLEILREYERSIHTIASIDDITFDIRKKYTYDMHLAAWFLLESFTLSGPWDTKVIHANDIFEFAQGRKDFDSDISWVSRTFGLKRPTIGLNMTDEIFAARLSVWASEPLRKIYGITVSPTKVKLLYKINVKFPFAKEENDDLVPVIYIHNKLMEFVERKKGAQHLSKKGKVVVNNILDFSDAIDDRDELLKE